MFAIERFEDWDALVDGAVVDDLEQLFAGDDVGLVPARSARSRRRAPRHVLDEAHVERASDAHAGEPKEILYDMLE